MTFSETKNPYSTAGLLFICTMSSGAPKSIPKCAYMIFPSTLYRCRDHQWVAINLLAIDLCARLPMKLWTLYRKTWYLQVFFS